MPNVVHLLSDVDFYTISHSIEQTNTDDIFYIGTISRFNTITIIKVSEVEMKPIDYFTIPLMTKLPKKLRNLHLKYVKFDLLKIDSQTDTFTLFTKLTSTDKKQYVYQVNCRFGDIVDIKPILPLYEKNVYMGYTDTTSITYSDKVTKVRVKGLLYIDTDNPDKVGGKYIRRIPVYTDVNEKEELKSKGLIQDYDEFPIVDLWDSNYPVVLRLPDETKGLESDFSAGMSRLKLG